MSFYDLNPPEFPPRSSHIIRQMRSDFPAFDHLNRCRSFEDRVGGLKPGTDLGGRNKLHESCEQARQIEHFLIRPRDWSQGLAASEVSMPIIRKVTFSLR